jgi:hypothetical protein
MFDLKLTAGKDPYFGWTREKYIIERPPQAGDTMLIVNTQAGFEEYVLATVENPDSGKQHRVILGQAAAWGGASFYRSGRTATHPPERAA